MEKIKGKIVYIVYHNEQNNFCVARFLEHTTKETITITGKLLKPDIQFKYELEGEYSFHPKYGEQFQFISCNPIIESSKKGVINYLSSSKFKGIGKKTAEKIVDYYPENTIELIKNDFQLLDKLDLTLTQKNNIIMVLAEENIANEHIRLQQLGFSNRNINSIMKKYSNEGIRILYEHPYLVSLNIDGISNRMIDYFVNQEQINYQEFEKEVAYFFEEFK